MTESVIVPDQQLLHPETLAKDELDKLFRAVGCEVMRERHDREVIHAGLRDHFELFLGRREKERRSRRIDDLERMRIEAQQKTWCADVARSFHQPANALDMTQMHSIERPDGDNSSAYRGWKARLLLIDHAINPPRRRPTASEEPASQSKWRRALRRRQRRMVRFWFF